jgi:hypothetical protein
MCAYETAGALYGFDNGVPISKKLAADLVNPDRLQADLFLRPNEDDNVQNLSHFQDLDDLAHRLLVTHRCSFLILEEAVNPHSLSRATKWL